MPVSLCATVFNEAESIDVWLDSIMAQTRPPDEVIICDAGSTDGTIDRLLEYAEADSRVRVLVEPGANVPEGRNAAIAAAGNQVVAIADAGTILRIDWLELLVAPLEESSEVGVSAGFYAPAGRNPFERVLATVITPRRGDIDDDGFPPSSRSVAFRKEWWEKVGGYPEWLRAGEDLVFDFRLRDEGARFHFAEEAIVSWYPRPTLGEFFAQYRHYARGDGHGHLFTGRHGLRYLAYVLGLLLAWRSGRSKPARLLLAAGFFAHLRKYLGRVRDEKPYDDLAGAVQAYGLVPVVVITGDVAKMTGYPQGLWERLRAGGPEGLKTARIDSHRSATVRGGLRGEIRPDDAKKP